jgi:hypothetical protein
MLRFVVDVLVGLRDKVKVAELSQPTEFTRPDFVLVPALSNVKPFQVKGN